MSLFINNGLSGLLASQRALQTIANNVANANTEGYVRQQTNFAANPVQFRGGVGVGTGVHVDSIERVYDQFLGDEVKLATSAQARAQSFNEMANKLDGLLGNPDLNITTSIQRFFDQLEAVNRDPTSTVNREQLLAEGEALQSRFQQINGQLSGISNEVDNRLRVSVNSINNVAASLADINDRITRVSGDIPNDLLDQQERLLTQLAEEIDFTEIRRGNGEVDILIGNGQPIVLSSKPFSLSLAQNEFDGSKLELAYDSGGGPQPISNRISGGAVAGMLSFRNETLSVVNRELGQVALGLTETFNEQHRLGLDLNGQRGGDFFGTLAPTISASAKNVGSAVPSIDFGTVSATSAKNYELLFDGTAWQLSDADTGASITMTGSGGVGDPFVVEGMEITLTGAPANGDRFLLQPVSQIAGAFSMQITDPSEIAVASMLTTGAELSNTGSASVSGAAVSDPAAPGLLQPVQIVFTDPTTFRIEDTSGTDLSGPLTYTDGADINFSGWTLQIGGSPQTGDEFSVMPTSPGSGDNANGLILSKVPSNGYFSSGRLSIEGLGASMLTSIGSAAARSGQDLIVQNSLLDQAELDLQSLAGVNLEEEAANLLRYQEAYLASSKIIGIANDLFQTLLSTVGR